MTPLKLVRRAEKLLSRDRLDGRVILRRDTLAAIDEALECEDVLNSLGDLDIAFAQRLEDNGYDA